jgi:hypothetical protein
MPRPTRSNLRLAHLGATSVNGQFRAELLKIRSTRTTIGLVPS